MRSCTATPSNFIDSRRNKFPDRTRQLAGLRGLAAILCTSECADASTGRVCEPDVAHSQRERSDLVCRGYSRPNSVPLSANGDFNIDANGSFPDVTRNVVRGVNPAGQLWVIDKLPR
jgi:hypothetical protein